VHKDRLAPKPHSLSFAEAAALPVSGSTALQGVRDVGKVQSGESVLVIGAGGGVRTFAVQIAKARGARVTGVCSSSKTGWYAISALMRLSTTPAKTSARAAAATTSSSTRPGIERSAIFDRC
jgi:NADPH:quinone reductase-like Zn-dependent oxidoreductase